MSISVTGGLILCNAVDICYVSRYTVTLSVKVLSHSVAATVVSCLVQQKSEHPQYLSVELVTGGIDNDAAHSTNSSKDCDDSSSYDASPRRPEMPVGDSGLLDQQPED